MNKIEFEIEELEFHRENYEDRIDTLKPDQAISPSYRSNQLDCTTEHSKLAIVVGHSQQNPGAYCISPIKAYEYHWNVSLAKSILVLSREQNTNCSIFYRDGIGIAGAYDQVLAWNPDRCIELHLSDSNPISTGTETLYADKLLSELWAQTVQNAMIKLFAHSDTTDRGVNQLDPSQRGHINVSQLKTIPSCLVTPCFGQSVSDSLIGGKKMSEYAQALLDAFRLSVN